LLFKNIAVYKDAENVRQFQHILSDYLLIASDKFMLLGMPRAQAHSKFRSGCPLNASVEILGDRWSLLIIRDMMLRGFRSYTQFLESYEHIATNVLAHRLKKLGGYGIIATKQDPSDGRKLIYTLTQKGLDLAPVLTKMVLWAAAHEDTQNPKLVRQIKKDEQKFMAAVRQKWTETSSRTD
jgi:DNA-binding HxlR family transcriptional regulator